MAGAFKKMVDMALTPEEKRTDAPIGNLAMSEARSYPWGLQISLSEKELEKLGLDAECDVGDMVHLHAMARVTSVSQNASESGESASVGMQITHLEVEDEEDENEAEDAAEAKTPRRSLRSVY